MSSLLLNDRTNSACSQNWFGNVSYLLGFKHFGYSQKCFIIIGWEILLTQNDDCLLSSKGKCVSEVKVRKSLKKFDPACHQIKHETAGTPVNPKCYNADYFDDKVHLDQNEKLKMFGVTHVMARDDFSRMIVAFLRFLLKIILLFMTKYIKILEWHAVYGTKLVVRNLI